MTKKFHGGRRFLNKPGFHGLASIIAEIEDTTGYEDGDLDRWFHPSYTFQIADCDRHITLELDMETKEQRANNIYKVDQLLKTLTEFRNGLVQEQALYAARKKKHG